jgi:hypothetical protein
MFRRSRLRTSAKILNRRATRFLARAADVSTHPAMLVHVRMPFAFGTAHRTSKLTQLDHHAEHVLIGTGTPRCQRARRVTNVRAVEIEPNALAQLRDRRFGHARIGARGTGLRACIASVDTVDQRGIETTPRVRMGRNHLLRVHERAPSQCVHMQRNGPATVPEARQRARAASRRRDAAAAREWMSGRQPLALQPPACFSICVAHSSLHAAYSIASLC